ncbi:sugar efflux transporter [Cryptosporangium arvum]|uniref:Arabinose efflux permease family protein n=1 Tax=Cryptosporangium arvum DSM 44712 TaxID=927661 RepID=A0A011A0J1_9ACTN|nr:sugar efflux transporter [Cryptosporangium arvum]EXG83012.1 arabinose efflux permease family protein [Cryptosporangium arvum DSM 44712]
MTAVAEAPAREGARLWVPLSLVFLSVGLSMAMMFPFRALFLTDAVHAGPLLVTVFLIVAPVSGVVAASWIGRWSDTGPYRSRLIVAAALAGVVGSGLSAFVRNYWVLLFVTATAIAVSTAALPQLFAYARVVVGGGDRGTFSVSVLRTLMSASWVAGPLVAAILIEVGGYTLIFSVAAAIFAAVALLTHFGLPEPRGGAPAASEHPETPAEAPPIPAAGPVDVSEGSLRLNVVALVLIQTAATLSVQLLPLFVNADLNGDVRDTGFILGLCAFLEIPLILAFGALAARAGVRRLFLIGPLVSALYLGTVALSAGTGQVALAQLLNASGIALIQGIGITYFQDLLPSRPGRASTLFSNAFPIGSTLAAPLLGIAQQVGYRFGFVAAAVLSLAGLALLVTRRTR